MQVEADRKKRAAILESEGQFSVLHPARDQGHGAEVITPAFQPGRPILAVKAHGASVWSRPPPLMFSVPFSLAFVLNKEALSN